MNDNTSRIEQQVQFEHKPHLKFLPKLFFYVFRSARSICFLFVGLMILLSLMRPLLAFIWKQYIDLADSSSFLALFGLMLAYYVINFLADIINRYTNAWEEIERLDIVQHNRFDELFQSRIYKKLASLPSEYFEIPTINDRIERVFNFTMDGYNGINLEIMVQGYRIIGKVVSVISIAASLYILEPRLCWMILIAPIPSLYTTYIGSKLKFKFVKDNATAKRQADYYEKLMLGPASKEMKTLSLYDFFFEKWKTLIDRYTILERKTQMTSALLNVLASLIQSLSVAGATILAITQMTRGVLSLGGLGAAISLISTLMSDTGSLFSSVGGFIAKKNEATMFFNLMDLPEQPASSKEIRDIASVEVRDVSYRYPLTSSYVLEHIHLTIHQGEHIAFVGENGAGKSTFIRLLTGMLTPSSGEVLINGQPETEETRAGRYEAMASVLQNPAKYTTFTIGDNVMLGDPKRAQDPEQIRQALNAAGYEDADPDTLLGKDIGGTDLSGGQWQKISIARAHYRNRGFIVLDEPTGNLDPKAEAEAFQKYMDLSEGRTLIMVTHRISVASLADRIIVFDKGRIVEDGTHEELLAANGNYARLYHEQAKWYNR